MKISACLLFFLFPLALCAQPSKQYASVQKRKAFYQELSAKYNSPVIQEILAADKTNLFDTYVDGHSEKELVQAYGTVVHELLHSYNDSEIEAHLYLVAAGKKIRVPIGDYYNSKELNAVVRRGAQDSIFRYGLYVGGRSVLMGQQVDANNGKSGEVMSVSMGIYGLVEEFDAYFHDLLSQFELYSYIKSQEGQEDAIGMTKYMETLGLAAVPYYEFRFFISAYLLHAKQKHPDIYKDMMANAELRAAFKALEANYRGLIADLDELRASLEGTLEVNPFEIMDFSGTQDDFFSFCTLSGLEAKEVYREEITLLKGKEVRRKVSVMDKMVEEELRKMYGEMMQQIKDAGMPPTMSFLASPNAQKAYLTRLITPAHQVVWDAFLE